MSWFTRARRGCGSKRRLLGNHPLALESSRRQSSKKRFALPICRLAAALALLPPLAQSAFACSPRAPAVFIEAQIDKALFSQPKSCLDRNCRFIFEGEKYGFVVRTNDPDGKGAAWATEGRPGEGIQFLSFWSSYRNPYHVPATAWPLPEAAFLEALDRLIASDITDLHPVLRPEIESWAKNHTGFGGNLVFTPYDQGKESKLLEEKNQLLDCRYPEYQRVGDWLVVNWTSRDYCQLTAGSPWCPFPVVAYSQFFAFLLSHLNRTTAPYLAAWLALLVALGWCARSLFRKNELWFFLKPKVTTVVPTGVLGFVLLIFLWGTEALWWYLAVIYGSFSLVVYIGWKRRSEPRGVRRR